MAGGEVGPSHLKHSTQSWIVTERRVDQPLTTVTTTSAVSYLETVLLVSFAVSDAPQHDALDVNYWRRRTTSEKVHKLTLGSCQNYLVDDAITFSLR